MGSKRVCIHTRDDLISFIEDSINRRGMLRAFTNGDVEVLGGFKSIPPRNLPGWIVEARHTVGYAKYHVAVTVETGGIHRIWNLVTGVPWDQWIGDNEAYQNNQLMTGDHPDRYKEYKDDAGTSPEEVEAEGQR